MDGEQGPIDGDRLATLAGAGGGVELVAELVDLFVADVPARLDAIRSAIAAADPEALVRAAHSLKGSASTLGADGMADLCRRIELQARDGAVPPAREMFGMLQEEFERVKQALDAWVAAR